MTDFGKPPAPDGPPSGAELSREEAAEPDTLGVVAIVVGCIGILVAGIALCLVTGVLAAEAGRRARTAGRSMDNAYIALVLAAVDGLAWIVLHVLFDMHFVYG